MVLYCTNNTRMTLQTPRSKMQCVQSAQDRKNNPETLAQNKCMICAEFAEYQNSRIKVGRMH